MIKIQGKTKFQDKTIFDPGYNASDADAAAYIAAVEAADGSTLENGVREAIDTFVLGCKSDSIWSDIKAACILAGAKTLNGALVPLVGTAPTNSNFVSADYNRETGLVGDGSTKRLDTNRYIQDDPLDDMHMAVWATEISGTYPLAVAGNNTQLIDHRTRNRNSTLHATTHFGAAKIDALWGASRNSSTGFDVRQSSNNYSYTQTSALQTANIPFYAFSNGQTSYFGGRLTFYSIGESLDLSLLDSRVSTLMTDIAAAI